MDNLEGIIEQQRELIALQAEALAALQAQHADSVHQLQVIASSKQYRFCLHIGCSSSAQT